MTVNTSDNRWSVTTWIVAPTVAEGADFTTITAAMAAASSGDTISVKPGTYTENFTLKAGVDLIGLPSRKASSETKIVGTITYTDTGQASICNLSLQTNAANAISISGTNSGSLFLDNCYIRAEDFIAVSLNNANCSIQCWNCITSQASTYAMFVSTAGGILLNYCQTANSGGTVAASTIAAGGMSLRFCELNFPVSCSSAATIGLLHCRAPMSSHNLTIMTTAGTGASRVHHCELSSGTASAISVGAGTDVFCDESLIISSNTNAITGAGTIRYNCSFRGTSRLVNTTTKINHPMNTGTISFDNGSTYISSAMTTTTDGVCYFDGTQVQNTAVGTATHVLTSNGAGLAPTFQAAPGGGGTVTSVNGTASRITSSGGTDPIIDIDAAYVGQASITTLGTVTTGTWTATDVGVEHGGTGVSTLTDGGILLGSGTGAVTVTAQPTNGQLLIGSTGLDPVLATLTQPAAGLTITGGAGSITFALANGLAALEALASTGIVAHTAADTYAERTITGTASRISMTNGNGVAGNPTIDIDAAYVGQASITTLGTIATGTWNGTDIAVADGGTGRSSHTAYAVICGGTTTTAAQQSIASVGTSGQVLTSNGAGALPTFQAASGGGLTWTEVTGTSQSAAVNNGYITNNAGLVTVTLPDTAAVGDIVRVAGSGAGGFKIAQNAGETIHFLSQDTTTGVGGSLASTTRYDSVELICNIANTDWVVMQVSGNITVV